MEVLTAIERAVSQWKTNNLITGYWFLYDSNALEQLYPKNFKIILINNGGGIFRILPGT
jgi:2-succinyl-5-enolpyruvyl-6-hydroxy-3-cyclohexene-1-carboxylate synthase